MQKHHTDAQKYGGRNKRSGKKELKKEETEVKEYRKKISCYASAAVQQGKAKGKKGSTLLILLLFLKIAFYPSSKLGQVRQMISYRIDSRKCIYLCIENGKQATLEWDVGKENRKA